MERQTKYIDGKKLLANKEKISATIPQYIYNDLKNYSDLTGLNTTEIVTNALFDYFRYKTVTNTNLLGYGNLYFKLPLDSEFKTNAIANKVKLNIDLESTEPQEQIYIKTVTNNLDVFNGNTFFAGSELEKNNIKHIGIDFIIIPNAIKQSNAILFNKLDITITDALYIFYYEVTSANIIDVYLINPIDAVNKLSAVNSIKASAKLVECLQELETIETEINSEYEKEMHELHNNNSYVNNDKKTAVIDKYTAILLDLLKQSAIKFNSDNIKIGVDAFSNSFKEVKNNINQMKQTQENIKNIIDSKENTIKK